MKLVRIIKTHFVSNGRIYGWSAAPLAATATILGLSDLWDMKIAAKERDVRGWAVVTSRVVDSTIEESEIAMGKGYVRRVNVAARFSFDYKGEAILAEYAATWDREDEVNWSKFFAPDQRIKIRVSPEDPDRVSLMDHNGVP